MEAEPQEVAASDGEGVALGPATSSHPLRPFGRADDLADIKQRVAEKQAEMRAAKDPALVLAEPPRIQATTSAAWSHGVIYLTPAGYKWLCLCNPARCNGADAIISVASASRDGKPQKVLTPAIVHLRIKHGVNESAAQTNAKAKRAVQVGWDEVEEAVLVNSCPARAKRSCRKTFFLCLLPKQAQVSEQDAVHASLATASQVDKKRYAELLCACEMALDFLPFTHWEKASTRRTIRYIAYSALTEILPAAEHSRITPIVDAVSPVRVTRDLLQHRLLELYAAATDTVKDELRAIRKSSTVAPFHANLDLWTDVIASKKYVGVRVFYITLTGQLCSRLLAIKLFNPPAELLNSTKLSEILLIWLKQVKEKSRGFLFCAFWEQTCYDTCNSVRRCIYTAFIAQIFPCVFFNFEVQCFWGATKALFF
jgi:hypothetical protein